MGIKQIIIDDYDEETELPEGTEPVRFAFDGDVYDIYLSDENKSELKTVLDPFISKAVAVDDEPSTSARKTLSESQNQQIRAWAIDTKFQYEGVDGKMRTLGDRGQIPKVVVDAFREAKKGKK